MKIRKIQTIKEYKSFTNFSWENFCKDNSGNETVLSSFGVIFGENGSGKSSICDILKSLSQHHDFQNDSPTLAEIEIKNGGKNVYKFENNAWTPSKLNKDSFLFFDMDFINANVHTHGDRSNQQGRHSQNSGKMIIDLDDRANQLKREVAEKKETLSDFERGNSESLNETFSAEDKGLISIYKSKDENGIDSELADANNIIKDAEAELASLEKINKRYTEIKQLMLVDSLSSDFMISPKETYDEISSRKLKERAQDGADEKIKEHFNKHRRFIEESKDEVPLDYKNEDCPLCMQPLINASKFIEYYRTAFDKTYDDEKKKFLADLQGLKSELSALRLKLLALPEKSTSIFDSLEKIKIGFELDVYDSEKKAAHLKNFKDIDVMEIEEFISMLDSLTKINRENLDFSKKYEEIVKKVEETKKKINDFNELVKEKNEIISSFKNKYAEQSAIIVDIQSNTKKLIGARNKVAFLASGKLSRYKEKIQNLVQKDKLSEELKKIQEELKNHLANTIPESVITKMISILELFNLNFTLEHIKPAPNTKDYSFSFKIKDHKGNERNLRDGLSEGERQLISLAFFFAINENSPDKANTILVFDDPITSLDSPNLKILADLIHDKTSEFSQVLIFTHHPLFFKYLAKCENPNPCKYGILKNGESFGGSFIFFDPGFDLIDEVKKCNDEIKQDALSGKLKPEEIALKYGQLLRLAIEKFIKHDLLMWNRESNFEQEIVANLSKSKSKIQKLDEDDLEIMKNIHKYCNHSNLLHADKENPSALSELITHIGKFVDIQDKVK